MDNIIVGIVILAAVIFIGRKFYLSFTGQGGCGCGGGDSDSSSKKSSGCGGNCSCDGSNKALGIKRTDH